MTIESRFSKNKIMPYKQITKEDVVFVKKSSGNVELILQLNM